MDALEFYQKLQGAFWGPMPNSYEVGHREVKKAAPETREEVQELISGLWELDRREDVHAPWVGMMVEALQDAILILENPDLDLGD